GEDAALLGGLEEERARAAAGEFAVDADRCLSVREELASDGDDSACAEQRVELFSRGGSGGHVVPPASITTGSSRSASKHVRVPVWHAAPICSTRTSRVSPSQSRAAPRTYCTWPDVSPLRQYSCRERDQNVTRPSVMVRVNASASIQPTMSTSLLSHSWMTAVSRPFSSNLTRSRMPDAASRVSAPLANASVAPVCAGVFASMPSPLALIALPPRPPTGG